VSQPVTWANDAPPAISGTNLNLIARRVDVNVKDLGAVGNGTTDDSAAFAAAYNQAAGAIVESLSNPGEGVGRVRILVPPGRYRITQSAVMIAPGTPAPLSAGLVFEGCGQRVSEIVFDPPTADTYLMHNNRWRIVTFRELAFISDTPGARFLYSDRTTAVPVQDYRFERCQWDGSWSYGLVLAGADNNDSFVWDQCTVHGTWTEAYLYSGMTINEVGQDNHLQFAFLDCKVEYKSGNFLVFPYGGGINCIGGSYIITEAAGGTLFSMPWTGNSHLDGAQRLLLQGIRYETRNLNTKILDCHWHGGVVHVDNCVDTAFANVLTGIENLITYDFQGHNGGGPQIRFTNSEFLGRHRYTWGALDYRKRPSVRYEGCNIANWAEPAQFISQVSSGAAGADGNVGSRVPVEFVGCRTSKSGILPWLYPPDATVDWWIASNAQPKRRAIAFKSPYGGLPYTGEPTLDLWLPLGALITGIRFSKDAGTGSDAGTGWSYTVATSETTPTTLGAVSGGGTAAWSTSGFNSTIVVNNFRCGTDAKRHLTLTAANISQITSDSLCIVEYYG